MIATRRLWFSLIAPAVAFGAEGALGWGIGARVCTSMPVGTVRTLVGIATLAMIAVAGTGLAFAVANYREAAAIADVEADRVTFLALGGVIVSGTFLVGLIWFGLNGLLITVCGGIR